MPAATIDNPIVYHGSWLFPRKYPSTESCCPRPQVKPIATTATK